MKIQNVLQKCGGLCSGGRWIKGVSLALVASMVVGNTISVNAATIKDVFDAEYYSATYDDLARAFSKDAKALYNHYVEYGQEEGRGVVPFIDLKKYREAYADLDVAFGDDWDAYLEHYLTYGVYEGRKAFGKSFDARAYADRYPDLKAAFGYDVLALYDHYVNYGRDEGRNAMPDVPANNVTTSGTGSASTPSEPVVEVIPETVATTVTFVDEEGNPIPNATVTFTRIGEIGMNGNCDTVSGNDAVSGNDTVSGNDAVSGNDTVSGNDAVSGNDVAPGVSQEGDDTFVVTTDENGRYTVPELPSGIYSVVAEASGYLTLNMSSVEIGTQGSSQTIPTFEMLSGDISGTNIIEGYAKDAVTGAVLADVTIKIRADWNNYDGEVIDFTTTDTEGYYSFELTRGYYTIEFVHAGYSSVFVNIATSNRFDANRCSGIMNPTMSEVTSDQYRIVLTWGEQPFDLDSHLVGPNGDNNYFHVYFGCKDYSEDGSVVASLDIDDVDSFGPETVTVVNVRLDKTYYYSVHDFTNGWGDEQAGYMYLAESNAKIKVYIGSQLVKEYDVPVNEPGTIWNVFKIVNGSIVTINEINAEYDSMYGDYVQ